MVYYVRLLKGLKEPYISAQQLMKAEKVEGFWKKIGLLFLLTFLIAAITAYFGIGNELLSKELNSASSSQFEAEKSLFAVGQVIWLLLVTSFIIIVPSLFFWSISDIEWKKFIVIQVFVITIFLLERVVTMPFSIFIGLPEISSPFSLSIIGQYFTSNSIILQFLAHITIFKIWAIILQYKYIKVLSEKTPKQTALFVIGFNIVIMMISVFLTIMDLEKLL